MISIVAAQKTDEQVWSYGYTQNADKDSSICRSGSDEMRQNDSPRKYAAFISYRHVSPDKEIAKILHFLLEYNLVRPNKQTPRHIRPVFLDTSELPTMEDLDAGILQALDGAECLFVIGSPDLPKSKYCMREISYFKEKHGGSLDRVATLLVRGDPQESYPALLRTKLIPDPEDPSKSIETDVEPLYADIRAKTFLGSIWKLFSSEYLRLACRYFRCSYDVLKKRHKRNMTCFLMAAAILLAGIAGIVTVKEQQVRQTVADSYAGYANELTAAGDELTALTLCTYTECAHTDAYSTAVRNAYVQLDYKLRNMPVSQIMEADYSYSGLTNYYLSASGELLVVADGSIWQLTDAINGMPVRQFPYESAFVMGKHPQSYVVLDSRPDENGTFYDYLAVMDLKTNAMISEFPFRQASPDTTDYKVVSLIESNYTLNKLMDGDEDVAYFTDAGIQLTKEEFVEKALAFAADATDSQPYQLYKSKLTKGYSVKDAQGREVLAMDSTCTNYAFSDDWLYFIWASEDTLYVYDTGSWTLLARTAIEHSPQSIHLLPNSHYCVIGYRVAGDAQGDTTRSFVMDWQTGNVLITTDGTVLTHPTEPRFYTVTEGVIRGYIYTDLDMTDQSSVIAHAGDRVLTGAGDHFTLYDSETQQMMVQFEAVDVCTDEVFSCLLARTKKGLTCYGDHGQIRWSLEVSARNAAISPDGSRCVWLDLENTVHILDAATGSEETCIPSGSISEVGSVRQLAVTSQGVAVMGEKSAVWITHSAGDVISLGQFTEGTAFSDGMLILENQSRIGDFKMYDTRRNFAFNPSADNTGIWAYSPESGYLVRHIESTGNHPSLYLEVWKRDGRKLTLCGSIDIPSQFLRNLRLDSTGEYLSFTCDGESFVYALKDMRCVLHIRGAVYQENRKLYGITRYGDYQYSIPLHSTDTLLKLVETVLTSPVSRLTLTKEELAKYAISQ